MAMVNIFLKPSSSSATNAEISRLFLVEGIATVIFGVAIWFLLPDCKHSSLNRYIPTANTVNSPRDGIVVNREREEIHPGPTPIQRPSSQRAELQTPRGHRVPEGSKAVAVYLHLGDLYCRHARRDILPVHRDRQPWLYVS